MDKNGDVKYRSQHVSSGVYFISCSKINTHKNEKHTLMWKKHEYGKLPFDSYHKGKISWLSVRTSVLITISLLVLSTEVF